MLRLNDQLNRLASVKLSCPLVRLAETGIDSDLSFRHELVAFIVKDHERIGRDMKDNIFSFARVERYSAKSDELEVPDLVLVFKCLGLDLNDFVRLDAAFVFN